MFDALADIPAHDVSQWTETHPSARARKASKAAQASGQRQFTHPATCERDSRELETELLDAMRAYKASSGRMFPTWSEVLEVLQGLGYRKA